MKKLINFIKELISIKDIKECSLCGQWNDESKAKYCRNCEQPLN